MTGVQTCALPISGAAVHSLYALAELASIDFVPRLAVPEPLPPGFKTLKTHPEVLSKIERQICAALSKFGGKIGLKNLGHRIKPDLQKYFGGMSAEAFCRRFPEQLRIFAHEDNGELYVEYKTASQETGENLLP